MYPGTDISGNTRIPETTVGQFLRTIPSSTRPSKYQIDRDCQRA